VSQPCSSSKLTASSRLITVAALKQRSTSVSAKTWPSWLAPQLPVPAQILARSTAENLVSILARQRRATLVVAENVFWVLGTALTMGADSILLGNVLAGSAITIGTNGKIMGRAIAQTAVTCETACYIESRRRPSAIPTSAPTSEPTGAPTSAPTSEPPYRI
jgi:hypothetical protein